MDDEELVDLGDLLIPSWDPITDLGEPWLTRGAFGRKGSGKSKYAMRAVLYFLRTQIETVYSFNPSSKDSHDPAYYVPPAFDFDDWNAAAAESMYKWFGDMSRNGNKKYTIVTLDDCNAVTNEKNKTICVYREPIVRKIAKEGRQRGVGIFIAAQNFTDVDKSTRNQFHQVFLFATTDELEIENYRSAWAAHCSKNLFKALFLMITTPPDPANPMRKRCMVIDMTKVVSTVETSGIFVWEPPLITKPFVCGRAGYYKLSKDTVKTEVKGPQLNPWKVGGKGPGPAAAGPASASAAAARPAPYTRLDGGSAKPAAGPAPSTAKPAAGPAPSTAKPAAGPAPSTAKPTVGPRGLHIPAAALGKRRRSSKGRAALPSIVLPQVLEERVDDEPVEFALAGKRLEPVPCAPPCAPSLAGTKRRRDSTTSLEPAPCAPPCAPSLAGTKRRRDSTTSSYPSDKSS